MKIIDQWGNEHYTHEVEIRGGTVSCTPDKDRRKKEKLGVYNDIKRSAEIQAEIYCVNRNGQSEYVMPKE